LTLSTFLQNRLSAFYVQLSALFKSVFISFKSSPSNL